MSQPIYLFDIEATNLNANFGYVLCVAWKELGKSKINCMSVEDYATYKKDPTNDRELLKEVRDELSKAGALISWYGPGFDIKYINTRLIGHRETALPPIPNIDGWRIAKEKMKLTSNRLASVSAFLGVQEKTPLSGPIWIKASAGDTKALAYIKKHCKQDVVVLEEVYNLIKGLATTGPNVAAITDQPVESCPRCGKGPLQKRGFKITVAQKSQRYQCQSCGGWSHGRPVSIKGLIAR